MESLEHKLNCLEEIQKESLDKQKDFLYKSILEVSKTSSKNANNFDRSFMKNFPKINSIGKNEEIKPTCVVEFRNGKAFQVLNGLNELNDISDLLYNRIVMGTYYIDNGFEISKELLDKDTNYIHYCKSHNRFIDYNIRHNNNYECGCNSQNNNNLTYIDTNLLKNHYKNYVQRDEERNYFYNNIATYTFQVDNYLNLYHQDSGLYLLFNKTSFPKLPFYLAKQYTQLHNKDDIYYKIFFSKRIESLQTSLSSTTYKSLDNREKFLENINQLIPEDYQEVYDFYNSFRKFDGYEGLLETHVIQDGETNYLDSKDRLIQSLREKLKETISRIEKTEQLARNMIDEYQSKSIEIQDLRRKLDVSRITIEEIKSQENQKHISEIEKIKQEKFNLYQQLLESEKYRSMFDNLGISLESYKNDNQKLSLEIAKMRDINNGLLDTIREEKEKNQKTNQDNTFLLREMDEIKEKNNQKEQYMKELNKEISSLTNENKKLTTNLSEIGTNSSNALELALNDRVNELEITSKKHQDEKKKIIKENTVLKQRLNKIENTLKNLGL